MCPFHDCEVTVDGSGTHSFLGLVRVSYARHSKSYKRSLVSGKVSSNLRLEPMDILQCDGKRPDGATVVPLEGRKGISVGFNLS